MKRHKLDVSMDPEEIFEIMTEKHTMAAYIVAEIASKHSDGIGIVLDMDDMNIRGIQIYTAYLICKSDIKVLAEKVFNRDQQLCDDINKNLYIHKAVPRGAASEDRL